MFDSAGEPTADSSDVKVGVTNPPKVVFTDQASPRYVFLYKFTNQIALAWPSSLA